MMDNKEEKIEIVEGNLVYLTYHADVWYHESNPKFNIPMANRLAKIVKIFDWNTEEGKLLIDARVKNGKWGKLNMYDFKYVLKVYGPDLMSKTKTGIMVEEVLPEYYPGTGLRMFELVPKWMLKDIVKEEKKFRLEKNDIPNKQ